MTVKSTVTTLAIALLPAPVTPHLALGADTCAVGSWPAGVPEGSIEFSKYPIIDLAMSRLGEHSSRQDRYAPVGVHSAFRFPQFRRHGGALE